MIPRIALLMSCLPLFAACGEEDRTRAEAGAVWLAEHRLFRPFGEIGEIDKVYVESAEMVRLNVTIRESQHAALIDAQSLMLQSLIAKYACPSKGAELWRILGEDVKLRVDLTKGDEKLASGICQGS